MELLERGSTVDPCNHPGMVCFLSLQCLLGLDWIGACVFLLGCLLFAFACFSWCVRVFSGMDLQLKRVQPFRKRVHNGATVSMHISNDGSL